MAVKDWSMYSNVNNKSQFVISTETGRNAAFGNNTLSQKHKGIQNCAFGSYALHFNNRANYNSAFGQATLYNNTTGNNNCAFGQAALYNNTNGSNNTALGFNANKDGKGSLSTAVGANTKAEYENSTALGAGAQTTTENQIRLGKSGTSVYLDDIQLTSDKRDKTDIKESSLGLDFILGLNPVEYKWDRRDAYKDNKSDGSKKDKRVHHGFIAQDFQDLDFDFGGFQDHKLNGGEDQLSLNYLEFIAPLTKAIQEQQKIIERQQREIELLKKNI